MGNKIKLKTKNIDKGQLGLNLFFVVIVACYLIPFLMIVTVSLSNSEEVIKYGFRIFPKSIDFTAYKLIFSNASRIIRAYAVTISFTLLHTVLSTIITALIAYPISRKYFVLKKPLTWFIFFTMLFNGGMIPTYLTNVTYLNLGNSFWAYVFVGAAGIGGLVTAWNVMIVRTFYIGLPNEMFESAKIDGVGEFGIFTRIVVPLALPAYATIGFLTLVAKWNDWNTTLIYIKDPDLYSLQYLLQNMLRAAEELKRMAETSPEAALLLEGIEVPTEPMRFAMAIIAAGPVLLIFPWFQKYFAKGLTVGAVKG